MAILDVKFYFDPEVSTVAMFEAHSLSNFSGAGQRCAPVAGGLGTALWRKPMAFQDAAGSEDGVFSSWEPKGNQ